jgi:two-component system, chemotaxis family, response regulator Rcp1
MPTTSNSRCLSPVDILMVDDDLGDVALTQRALQYGKFLNQLHVARDGVEAMDYLRQRGEFAGAPRPDVILLDLNMPRKDGRELLAEIKRDVNLRTIPVVVLTTSDSDQDILRMYDLHANCYVTKPLDLAQFTKMVQQIKDFWFSVVKLPQSQQ